MKLKVTPTGAEAQSKHEESVRRGKNAKRKGGQYEREIAKKFQLRYGVELKRTPQSGGFAKKSEKADDYRGDITIVDTKKMLLVHIECKSHKVISLPQWLNQAKSDCPEGRIPLVVFHEHGTSNDFIALDYFDLISIANKVMKYDSDVKKPEIEVWKPITEFQDYYVSNCGRVKSLKPHNGKVPKNEVKSLILSPGIDSQGYEVVALRKNGKSYSIRVHKLVAKEFLSLDGMINHIDGDKTHNWVTNLEKSSYSENLQHAYDTGLHPKGEYHCQAKLTDLEVSKIRVYLNEGFDVDKLASEYNVSSTTINRIKSEDYRNPSNFHFDFKLCNRWSILKWMHDLKSSCPKGKTPCLVIGKDSYYACLSLDDFFNLVEVEKIVGRRKFK